MKTVSFYIGLAAIIAFTGVTAANAAVSVANPVVTATTPMAVTNPVATNVISMPATNNPMMPSLAFCNPPGRMDSLTNKCVCPQPGGVVGGGHMDYVNGSCQWVTGNQCTNGHVSVGNGAACRCQPGYTDNGNPNGPCIKIFNRNCTAYSWVAGCNGNQGTQGVHITCDSNLNSITTYDACVACPAGSTFQATVPSDPMRPGQGTCVASPCTGGQVSDSSGACHCPANLPDFVGQPKTCQAACTGGQVHDAVSGVCGCPSGQELFHNQCVAKCPVGQIRDLTTGTCGCPAGQVLQNGQCVNTNTGPGSCTFSAVYWGGPNNFGWGCGANATFTVNGTTSAVSTIVYTTLAGATSSSACKAACETALTNYGNAHCGNATQVNNHCTNLWNN